MTPDELLILGRKERELAAEAMGYRDFPAHCRHTVLSLWAMFGATGQAVDLAVVEAADPPVAPDLDAVTLAMLSSGSTVRCELWTSCVQHAMALLLTGRYHVALPWFARVLEALPDGDCPNLRQLQGYAESGLQMCILQGGQDPPHPDTLPLEGLNPFGAVFEALYQAGALASRQEFAAAVDLLRRAEPQDDLTADLFGDLVHGFRDEWAAVALGDFAGARQIARSLEDAVLRPGRRVAEMSSPGLVQLPGQDRMAYEMRLWNWLRAGGYALQLAEYDEALLDFAERARLEAVEGDTDRPGWLSLLMLSMGYYGLDDALTGCLLGKLAVAELQAERRRMAQLDEDLAKISGVNTAQCYDLLSAVLIWLGRHYEAREIAALRLGSEAMGRAGLALNQPSLDPLEEELRAHVLEATRDPQGLSGFFGTMRKVAGRLHEEAEESRSAFRAALAQAERQAWPEAAANDTLRLMFVPGEQDSPMTIMASGMGIDVSQPAGVSFEEASKLAFDLLQAIVQRTPAVWNLAVRASELLLAPIIGKLPQDAKRLVITAPGPLHALPWAALSNGRIRLIECFDLVRAAPQGVDLQRRPRSPARLLACAAADGGAGFLPLPNVQAEVRALGASWILDGRLGFTRDQLLQALPAASMLHIAGHFHADAVDLAQSVLLLGDGSLLTLAELMSLGLDHLDLIVLSACNSGMVAGRQNWSPAFAIDHLLMSAGVPAALGTLWPVEDEATAAFMSRFHAALALGMDKAAALGAAQRAFLSGELSEHWSHPYYWAAPVLSGNWRGLKEA